MRQTTPIDLPLACQAVLIIEVDGDGHLLDDQIRTIGDIVKPLDMLTIRVAETAEEADAIWKVRRSVSPSLRRLNPHKFNEDIVVPRSRVPEMIRALDSISQRYGVPIVNFGHAGDGNIHVNVMVNLDEPGMDTKVKQALDDIFRATVRLGGSVSGEHGIGIAKADYIGMEVDPETLAVMRAIKQALDPNNIMNPGKIFPETSAIHAHPIL